nr:MAG TPA: hypothetical protein [Caudoviricetes sp.]
MFFALTYQSPSIFCIIFETLKYPTVIKTVVFLTL